MPAGELIGRERELASLTEMLSDRATRLVTVTGPAGVGKTRLATAAAQAIAPDLPGGVVRVDLAPLEDARLVAEAIAVAAGAGSSRGTSALDAAVAALRDEQVLLVLDNFEHVARAAHDVGALLDACSGVSALVTSRHVLGLSAERTLPLAPLATPTVEEATPAVALFVARARARDPEFELTPDIAASVAEICRRLDGLPLAIELAAARVAVLAPPAMLARWDAAVGLDTEGARDLPSRQRTLRSAFDWSYDLLEPDEQALLRRLAAFPDGFDVQAVEAAQRGDGGVLAPLGLDPIATLGALVDRSLLHREAGSAAEPRFSMLATVRAYLRERLAEDGEEAAAELWMATVCATAAHQEGRVFGAGCTGEELDRLDRELNNLRAALEVLLAQAPGRALDLCGDLYRLWSARHVREGRDWLDRALRAAGRDVSPAVRARALFAATWLAHFQGDYDARRRTADECLAAAQSADDPLLLARALYVTGVALIEEDPAAAAERYRESLALCQRLGDDIGIATASNDLGEIARAAGALDEAQAHYGRALDLWRANGRCDGRRARSPQPGSGRARRRRPCACRRAAARVAGGERRDGRPSPAGRDAGRHRQRGRAARAGHRRRDAVRGSGGGACSRRDRPRRDRRRALRARGHAPADRLGGAARARGAGTRARARAPADGPPGGAVAVWRRGGRPRGRRAQPARA